ncbi:hypothetical protein FHS83_001719 [Rhizomicrobium palustre]|uniref:Amine oxidase domain-containing protein n=1 Tax=Rhizomicrobium palustre TaxID=189966 RepID=A0A846MZ79_9PROT|nr:FAD-dependent oxidoreductase [Rhizomicrobium palustre]NIK88401.1 hypothetical protein [Rhizomicrobium palustre]
MERRRIAVVGSGISGLSAAWLLAGRHQVTLYEKGERLGGHSNTVEVMLDGAPVAVDTGFIVFNRKTYPNLTALFAHLGVRAADSDMSFAISLERGRTEYHCGGLAGIFAQKRNLFSPRHWRMVADIVRFQREVRADMTRPGSSSLSLQEYFDRGGYGPAFREDHLLPMASAIWSSAHADTLGLPVEALVQFFDNHGLLTLEKTVKWETVLGGSKNYVKSLAQGFEIKLDRPVAAIRRQKDGVVIEDGAGGSERFDDVVIAAHADQALKMLVDADAAEHETLGAFRYSRNLAVLHRDESFMPRKRNVWSSWNFVGRRGAPQDRVAVTYWMNRLQPLATKRDLFVTLNPEHTPRHGTLLHSEVYHHPIFNSQTAAAQKKLWSLQGRRNTWFAGAYFGAGFHEDGLQAGLAVAEQLGGVRRPWNVMNESGRIHVGEPVMASLA